MRFYSDGGHGWLRVSKADHRRLNELHSRWGRYQFNPSTCSYVSPAGNWYLEEDCDAPAFILAWTAAGMGPIAIQELRCDGECWIRDLPRYQKRRGNEEAAWKVQQREEFERVQGV